MFIIKVVVFLAHLPYLFGYNTGFSHYKMTTNNYISPMYFAMIWVLPFLNSPKDLDLSYKTDLDFWIILEGKKNLCLIIEEIW